MRSKLKNLYLMYDLEPNNRFFLVQDWHAYFSPRIREEIVDDFADNMPEYLLTDVEYVPGEDWFVIHDAVESNYHLIEARDGCKLYQRKVG